MPSDCKVSCHSHSPEPHNQTDQLTALARQARMLEIGLKLDDEAAGKIAVDLEIALTTAMDAESADELTQARAAIDLVLGSVVDFGLSLSAELSDIEVEGVLGFRRMPVLTAVISAPA